MAASSKAALRRLEQRRRAATRPGFAIFRIGPLQDRDFKRTLVHANLEPMYENQHGSIVLVPKQMRSSQMSCMQVPTVLKK